MKKALALVLALVLALSMAVSAFAATLVELKPANPTEDKMIEIEVVDAKETKTVVYVDCAGTYYIALADKAYTDVVVTANGCVDAKLVEYDPETMVVSGLDIFYAVTRKGEVVEEGLSYTDAKKAAADKNAAEKVTYYGYKLVTNVNIIEVKVADNYTAHYTEGTIEITAKLVENKVEKAVSKTLAFVNDVVIFEYEEVKYAAANSKTAALQLGSKGYSDFETAKDGYGFKYDETELRVKPGALVVSTTAFRAIEGKDLKLNVLDTKDAKVNVTLKEIAAGQKGVNFFCYADINWDKASDNLVAATFGFKGEQVIAGAYEIVVDLPVDYYELRELFGLKVEEEDIITYYVINEDGEVECEKTVDYMKDDLSENVKVTIKGENDTLGSYTLCLEAPAVEEEATEENPNTGAEAVVGVVAALAVVSVATAAAVSLKK